MALSHRVNLEEVRRIRCIHDLDGDSLDLRGLAAGPVVPSNCGGRTFPPSMTALGSTSRAAKGINFNRYVDLRPFYLIQLLRGH